jgi:hypothetical protein
MKIELTKSQLLAKADLIEQEMAKYNYTGTQKIMAIKALRQLSSDQKWSGNTMLLADAKWAVENYPRFIAFVREHDRLPLDDYSQLQ